MYMCVIINFTIRFKLHLTHKITVAVTNFAHAVNSKGHSCSP